MALTKDTTTLTGETIVTDATLGGVAIDYTGYYERIATALETIATNSTAIKDSLESIEIKQSEISDHLDTQGTANNFASQIERIRSLGDRSGDGGGFRTVQPFGEIGAAILWLLYLEDGKILDKELASDEQLQASITRLSEILARARSAGDF